MREIKYYTLREIPEIKDEAAFSAAGSVFLEWYVPLRNWKIERDLWHHPRKYVVPGIIILLASLCNIITF